MNLTVFTTTLLVIYILSIVVVLYVSRMRNEKMNDFHKPFLQSLILILLCTIISVASAGPIVSILYSNFYKTPAFTKLQSDFSSEPSR